MPSPADPAHELRTRLRRARAHWRRRQVIRATALAFSAAPLLSLLVMPWLSGWSAMRLVPAFATLGALAWIIRAALRVPGHHTLARKLERHHPELAGLLSASLEFSTQDPPRAAESSALRTEAIRRAAALRWDLSPHLPQPGWRRAGQLVSATIWLMAILIFLAPGPLYRSWATLQGNTRAALEPRIGAYTGTNAIAEGQPAEIWARLLASSLPDTIEVGVNEGSQGWRWRPVSRTTQNEFRFVVREPRRDFRAAFRWGDVTSDTLGVMVRERPRVIELSVHATPPPYTSLSPLDSPGDLVVPAGSQIAVTGRSNVTLASAELAFGPPPHSQHLDAPLHAGDGFRAEFEAPRDTTWRVLLSDRHGTPAVRPLVHRVVTIPDAPPRVRIEIPAADVDLDEAMRVDVRWSARDDYGVRAAELRWVLENGQAGVVPAPFSTLDGETTGTLTWDLSSLDLMPGEYASFRIHVADNRPKAQWGASEVRRARFPTIAEIYADVSGEDDAGVALARELTESLEELAEVMEDIRATASADDDVRWDTKQELEALQEKAQALAEHIGDLETSVSEQAQSLEQAAPLATEIAEKYAEVQSLLQDALDEGLRKLLDALTSAMQAEDAAQLTDALDEAVRSDEEILRDLERTAEILEHLRQERALDQAIQLAADLAEREARIAEALESMATEADSAQEEAGTTPPPPGGESIQDDKSNSSPDDDAARERLARSQDSAGRDMEALADHLEALSSNEDLLEPEVSEAISRAADDALGETAMAEAGRLSREIRSGDSRAAGQLGRRAQGRMENLTARLEQARADHMSSMRQDVAAAMEKATIELLGLSELTEASLDNATRAPLQTAAIQSDAARALERVGSEIEALGKQTLFVTPSVHRIINQASELLGQSSDAIAQGRSRNGKELGRAGLSSINGAAAQLLESLRALGAGASASGYPEAMAALAEAAAAQAALAGESASLPMPGPGGQLGEEGRASFARLAAEQRRIRQLVAQARDSLGGDGFGDLRAIEEQMQAVEDALHSEQFGPAAAKQQRQITSRLLDAQRSIRKQGTSERRQAEAAKAYSWRPAPGLPEPQEPKAQRPIDREAILEALRDSFPAQYEDLVRAYFRALAGDPP